MKKFFVLLFVFLFSSTFLGITAFAAPGVPEIISHQGRLLDSSGNLLGGSSGTNYCFRFSFYDDASVGGGDNKLWPSGSPSTMTVNVKSGVFNVGIGDVAAGGDLLDFDFNSTDEAYLNTEVAAQVAGSCAGVSFENLSPRQRINSSGYAVNASTVGGFAASQSASGDDVVALTSDDLILGGTNPEIAASGSNTLTLQGAGATGALQFFSSSNSITSAGALSIAGAFDAAGALQSGSSNVALTLATGFLDADAITLTTSGGTGATSSNSGLEAIGDGLTLLKGCSDGQILKYTDAGGWACASDASGGGGLSDGPYGDIDISGFGSTFTINATGVTSLEALLALQDLQGSVTDTQVPNNITIDLATTAGTLTGLTSSIAELNILDGVTSTAAELNLLDGITVLSGSNTGDQTSIVGITGTIAQFNTALTDGDFATGGGTATGTNTGDQTSVTGNAGTVTFADAAGDTTTFVALGTSATGSLSPATDAGLTYNATTNALFATSFVGALTGNASTATALAVARNINGVAFDGSADITVTAAAGTLSGATLASNVLSSSLTAVGALDAGSITSGFGAINLGTDNFTTTGIVSTDTLTLTNTGTLNGLDAIDATGEATLEAALDIGGDVTGTGLSAVVIADNAVDGTQIALGSDAQGDIMYYDGTNWARLAAGTAGNVLQTNGVGANPSWAAAAAGDITAIGDVASGAAFNGSAGTTLTFDDSDGDQAIAYDTTNNEFDISDDVSIAGTLAATGGISIDATTESNIESAVDIAGDIDGTGLAAVDLDEAAVEAELESVIDLADLQGAVIDGQVPNNITIDLATAASDLSCTDCINATEIEDIYVLNGGDTITGALTINDNNGAASTLVTIGDANDADSLAVFGDITISGGDITLGTSSILSGGDTASLNNIDAIDATTETTIETAIDALVNLVTTGTLTGGATGAGFTLNFGTSTLSGNIGTANIAGLDVSDDINLTAGDGTVLTGDDVAVDLKTSTENGVGTASSASGLEFESGQLTLLQGCADNEILKWDETDDDWNCEADSGGTFDSTTVDSVTWSDGANASNVWTFDVSGTDHTVTFGNGLVTFSNNVTVTGTLATTAGLTIDANTETNIEAALDTLSGVTTVGALDAGSITSGFGAINLGTDNFTTTGTVFANTIDRSTSGVLVVGSSTGSTGVSLCNTTLCDTITIGSNADNDTITIGDSSDTAVSITDNNWSITTAGLITTSGGLSVTAGDVALVDNTGTTWSITNAGVATLGASVTVAGTGDGTDALSLSQGDILITDGDFDLSSGDFNVTLDSGDGASITSNSGASADALTVTLAGTSDTAGIDGLFINATASNQTDRTVNALNISLAAGGTTSGDVARGVFLDLASVGNAANTTKAIEIENTVAWDTDIELQNDETISNGTDGVIDFSGALEAGSSDVSLTLGTGFIDADAITLTSATNGLSGTSSSSGLAVHSDGLSLLQGCNDGQVLKWIESTDTWDCALDSSGGLSDLDYGDITVSSSGSVWDIDILASADGLSSTTSNGSGIESVASGLGLLQGCSDGQILKWTEASDVWGCAADNSGGSITPDSLDFTELANSMSVDEVTDINLGASNFSIDMDSTGDFSIRDGVTNIATFNDQGAITFAPTAGQDFAVGLAAGTNFQLNASAAPTVDMVDLTNSGLGTTTAGVDGISLTFETGDGSNNTNSALDINLTNGGTAAGDVLRGITINNITPTAGTETGLYIGTGFDYDLQFADATATIQLTDRGTLSIVDGASGVGTLLAVGSNASRGDLEVYGDIVKKGYTDQTSISNINDVFVYDTAKDTDGGAWTSSVKSQGASWYTETKDDGAGDSCSVASDDRCGTSSFPKKAILVAASDALYIFDGNSNTLWMKFSQASTGALGADTNNNPSSVFAQNGTIYVGTNGASGTGMYEFDFTGDKMFRYNTTNQSMADVAISGRNGTVTYNVNSNTNLAFRGANANLVNDVHATTIIGGAAVQTNGGPLNGGRFIVAATDDGIQAVNMNTKITYVFGNGAITDNYQSVYVTRRGRVFGLNSTDSSVDRFGLSANSANSIDVTQADITSVAKSFNGTTRPASLWKSAPTINTGAPDALDVCEQCSYAEVDTVATGRGDVLYVGHSLGLTEIHDTALVSSATVQPWSKFYTNAMQTDYMAATNKGMYAFEDTTGDLTDAALTNNVLEPENAPTYGVNGVRGYGLRFDGSTDYLCSDVDNNGACDVETDFASTTTAFHVSFWFKTNGTVSTVQTLVDKSTTTAAGAAGTGWRVWLTNTGTIAFGVDDDTTFNPDDQATSTDDYDDSQWHHVVAQRQNATGLLLLFVDGKLVGSDAAISATLTLETAASVLTVGARCTVVAACTVAQEFFNGDMDDLVFAMGGATTTDTLNQGQARRLYLAGLEAMKHKTIAVTDATGASSNTIEDSGEAWIPNEFVGQIVEITEGTGVGQTRRVISNTATTLTVSPAWSTTPDTTSNFAIEPEFLYGSSTNVTSVAATQDPLFGQTQALYVGTDQGSDGGGVTVFNGFGNTFVSDVYHSDSEKTDTGGTEWTGTDFDDIQAIDLKSGIAVMASASGTWVEMPDKDINQSLDQLVGNLALMRAELIADSMQATGLEYGAVGSADLAEYYYSNEILEPGEVVAIQPDQPAGIGKSKEKYQKNLLGVVSTQPALTMGAMAENAYAIALAGRIPVKITDENGLVHVGDELTASSKPGFAMKATKAGAVLGRVINEPEAMASCEAPTPLTMAESVGEGPGVEGNGGLPEEITWTDPNWQASDDEEDAPEINEPDPEDPQCGYAMVFIGLSDSLGKNIDELADEFIASDAYEPLDGVGIAADDTLKGQKEIMAFLESVNDSYEDDEKLESVFTDKIAAAVEIVAPSVYTKGLTVESISSWGDAISFMNDVVFIGRPYFNSDTAGFAVILEGAKKVDVTFTTPYLTQPVVSADVSFESLDGEAAVANFDLEEELFLANVDYIVTRKSVNGFTILLNKPAPQDIKFSWIALAVEGAITSEGAPDGTEEEAEEEATPETPEPPVAGDGIGDEDGGIIDGTDTPDQTEDEDEEGDVMGESVEDIVDEEPESGAPNEGEIPQDNAPEAGDGAEGPVSEDGGDVQDDQSLDEQAPSEDPGQGL